MLTENGADIDFEAVERLFTEGDVITVGFPLIPHRLLVDTRCGRALGAWAGLVEPLPSVQERYAWLGQHRGSLGVPEGFAFFTWPKTVRNLHERGVLAPLRARLDGPAQAMLDQAVAQALRMERGAVQEAVMGTAAWPAIWEAPAGG